MQWTVLLGIVFGFLGSALAASPESGPTPSTKGGPPPVILHLGPVVPTPAPTPKSADRKRLITVITIQNNPKGETVASFEATDVSDEGKDRIHTLASKTYSLADDNPKLKDLQHRILEQIRVLERQMLEYAEKAGPPKERAPLAPSSRPR